MHCQMKHYALKSVSPLVGCDYINIFLVDGTYVLERSPALLTIVEALSGNRPSAVFATVEGGELLSARAIDGYIDTVLGWRNAKDTVNEFGDGKSWVEK